MIYFMYAIASIILFNLLVLAFIIRKIGIEGLMGLFFTDEEATKDNPQNALSDDSRLVNRLSGTNVP